MTRVLHLSYSNAAGLPQTWCRAHRDAGIDAVHVAEIHNDFGYTSDHVIRWSVGGLSKRVEEWVRWATHIVIHDSPHYLQFVIPTGKPFSYRAFGTHTYENLDKVLGATSPEQRTCDFAEYVHLGFQWVPMPVYVEDFAGYVGEKHDRFTVAHAPSQRPVKGTDGVIRACQKAGIALDLIEGVSNEECLQRKGKCHALVDMIITAGHPHPERSMGFAVNGLEAMAMGIPVLGEQHPSQVASQRIIDGKLPYINVTEGTLPDALFRLRDNPEFYRERMREGYRYLIRHRMPNHCARKDLAVLGIEI